ncbi:MAG: hypothetical protein AAB964_00505, partial [Patescibacteria group bacterium]
MADYKKKLEDLIALVVAQGASDLHLSESVQPIIRVSGSLTPILAEPVLTREDMQGMMAAMFS